MLKEIVELFEHVSLLSDISNENMKQSVVEIKKVSNKFTNLLNEVEMLMNLSKQNSEATEEIVLTK